MQGGEGRGIVACAFLTIACSGEEGGVLLPALQFGEELVPCQTGPRGDGRLRPGKWVPLYQTSKPSSIP